MEDGSTGGITLNDNKRNTTQIVIYLIGISEGLTHLATLATYYLFKDDLRLSPAQVSALFFIPAFPWFIKPLFAFCSDTYPIFGMKRKPYLFIFSILQSIGYLWMAFYLKSLFSAVSALFCISFASAFVSAIAEALVVEQGGSKTKITPHEMVTEFITAKALGSLIVAYLSGYLLEKISKSTVFLTTAMFPIMITISCFFMVEQPLPPLRNIREQMKILKGFLSEKVIWGPMLYILFYMGGPDYDDAMFFYYTNFIGFTPTFMGTLRFTYGIASIIGILIYKIFKDAPYRSILFWSVIIALPIYISPIILVSRLNLKIGISDEFFVLSGGFLSEAVAEVQLLPLLVFASYVAPPGLEGTVYGVLMSVRNLGSAISKLLSALLIKALGITANQFNHLGLLILICGFFTLFPLNTINYIADDAEIHTWKEKWHSELEDEEKKPLI